MRCGRLERDIDQFLLLTASTHVPVITTQLKWRNGAPPSAFALKGGHHEGQLP
jgi:hypothetical protein